jgi:hypothetical protein
MYKCIYISLSNNYRKSSFSILTMPKIAPNPPVVSPVNLSAMYPVEYYVHIYINIYMYIHIYIYIYMYIYIHTYRQEYETLFQVIILSKHYHHHYTACMKFNLSLLIKHERSSLRRPNILLSCGLYRNT